MSSARNVILARVRRAQLTGRIPGFGADRVQEFAFQEFAFVALS